MLIGLCLYAINRDPSQMWGCLQSRDKIVTYLLKPLGFGNLRDGCDPSQLPLPNQIFRILPLSFEPTQGCQNLTGHTGMLGGLVGSHTQATIYPTYAISYERL